MNYRREIDGLRALAVLFVIIYHAQVDVFGRTLFKGGFIGVDIFFVISGFLITRLILFELKIKNTFNILNFYERRARRIIPMLLVIILASIPLAYNKLLPADFIEFSQSILTSLFFVSNFFFFFSMVEYGAESALLKPLLHTWSLGVEEQFYIVLPVFILLIWKFCRTSLLTLIVIMLILSLQFAYVMEGKNSELNFFLPFSRFWELLVGSVVAIYELRFGRVKNKLWRQILPAIGLILIINSLLFFDENTPHPSYHTLTPILGIALVLAFCSTEDFVGKILSLKPIAGIGLISYSLYLWHFPVFAFFRMGTTPNNYDKLEWILLTFALSVLSYFIIEKPFRNVHLINKKLFMLIITIGMTLCIGFSFVILANNGYSNKYPLMNYSFDFDELNKESWSLVRNKENQYSDNTKIKVLLVGNSHSKDMFNAFQQNANFLKSFDFKRYGRSGDNQILCFDETIDGFEKYRSSFYNSDDYLRAELVIISSNINTEDRSCKKHQGEEGYSNDIKALPYLIRKIFKDNKRVILMGNHPFFGLHEGRSPISDLIVQRIYENKFNLTEVVQTVNRRMLAELNYKRIERVDDELQKISSSFEIPLFSKLPYICEKEICFGLSESGKKLFLDKSHWTLEGAKYFGGKMVSSSLHECMLRMDDCKY